MEQSLVLASPRENHERTKTLFPESQQFRDPVIKNPTQRIDFRNNAALAGRLRPVRVEAARLVGTLERVRAEEIPLRLHKVRRQPF